MVAKPRRARRPALLSAAVVAQLAGAAPVVGGPLAAQQRRELPLVWILPLPLAQLRALSQLAWHVT